MHDLLFKNIFIKLIRKTLAMCVKSSWMSISSQQICEIISCLPRLIYIMSLRAYSEPIYIVLSNVHGNGTLC